MQQEVEQTGTDREVKVVSSSRSRLILHRRRNDDGIGFVSHTQVLSNRQKMKGTVAEQVNRFHVCVLLSRSLMMMVVMIVMMMMMMVTMITDDPDSTGHKR